ncbi:MAG: hypothetical protein ACI93L_003443 [Cyclobacteriaceae bacterium]|jgi:hypothetical protein
MLTVTHHNSQEKNCRFSSVCILTQLFFGQCPDFESMQELASYLAERQTQHKTANEQQKVDIEQTFFCAFPNSFSEMKTGDAAPLYDYPEGMNTIVLFAELKKIEPSKFYEKNVSINVNHDWQADNIGDAFVLA